MGLNIEFKIACNNIFYLVVVTTLGGPIQLIIDEETWLNLLLPYQWSDSITFSMKKNDGKAHDKNDGKLYS